MNPGDYTVAYLCPFRTDVDGRITLNECEAYARHRQLYQTSGKGMKQAVFMAEIVYAKFYATPRNTHCHFLIAVAGAITYVAGVVIGACTLPGIPLERRQALVESLRQVVESDCPHISTTLGDWKRDNGIRDLDVGQLGHRRQQWLHAIAELRSECDFEAIVVEYILASTEVAYRNLGLVTLSHVS
jgi:hypothetical protein